MPDEASVRRLRCEMIARCKRWTFADAYALRGIAADDEQAHGSPEELPCFGDNVGDGHPNRVLCDDKEFEDVVGTEVTVHETTLGESPGVVKTY